MKITSTMPESAIIEELGRRARQQRIGQNLTQSQLADWAGVSVRTIERFEAGASIQLDKFVRIVRALRSSDNLDQMFPEADVRPLQLINARSGVRLRASSRKSSRAAPAGEWKWGDEQ